MQNREKLAKAVEYVDMLDNPFCTPAEIVMDYHNCYSSPQPTKKRHHGESYDNSCFTLAEIKVPKSPKISPNVSDEEFLV